MHNLPSWPSKRQKLWALLVLVVLLGWAGYYELCQVLRGVAEDYAQIEEHFKYGSIGSDNLRRGLPYWIWKVLPDMFSAEYKEIGLNVEPGKDRPIGFSRRRILGMDIVGLNCAFCHVSTIRPTADSKPQFILGMPGDTVNVEQFFKFLFLAAEKNRFEADNVMEKILKINPDMGFIDRMSYRHIIIPLYRYEIGKLKNKFSFIYWTVRTEDNNIFCQTNNCRTEFGPGRIDTWVVYKVLKLQEPFGLLDLLPTPDFGKGHILPPGDVTGLADFPAIWPEKIKGMKLHWDGNNDVLQERNSIAAIGAGATPAALDVPRLKRVTQWIVQLSPPKYYDKKWVPPDIERQFPENSELRAKGKTLYQKNCAYCHDVNGKNTPSIEPIGTLGTDPSRLDAFTEALKNKLNKVGEGYPWRLHSFVQTDGYANLLLDGIWLRAPYLHNGSVPTLRDLLKRPADRPPKFCRGNDAYDWVNVGFKSDLVAGSCGQFFLYDTSLKGNHNTGHPYGTALSSEDKEALIEYLKTL